MLIPDNIHPQQSIYYNGSFVLQLLQENKKQKMLDLYQRVRQKKDMSFPIFVLCLDWLFLIDLIKLNSESEIQLCS